MAGFWSSLSNQPTFQASTMLLLTDGSVFCQAAESPNWSRLTPDSTGSYLNGTWSAAAAGPNGPLYYASAVLRDGRVFVAGGEYNSTGGSDILAAELYNPETDSWQVLSTPGGWTNIGDAPSCVLPDGRLMLGSIHDTQTAIYDPVANTWTAAANKHDASSEETWTLLPDQTIMVCECSAHPATEKYVIAADTWVSSGTTPSDLVEAASIEIGPAILLPDGRLFAIGATEHTALYTMGAIANQAGTWSDGPVFPPQAVGQTLGAKDAPACLLPNGRVLCTASPVDGISGNYNSPTYFFEYDPAANTLSAVANPPTTGGPCYVGRMLLLPTGQVLYSTGSTNVQIYTPDGGPDPFWKPRITSCPTHLLQGFSYTLSGQQINGLSQAVSYGDDGQMATNYPLVKLTNSSGVYYCRTFNHSTMGVNTGTVVHTTEFKVPTGISRGAAQLTVIANGIESDPIAVTVGFFKIKKEFKEIKEIKLEIKELKENHKIELDGVKLVVENKLKDAETVQQTTGEQEFLTVLQKIATRLDDHEEQLAAQRAFIQPSERPEVGRAALQQEAEATPKAPLPPAKKKT